MARPYVRPLLTVTPSCLPGSRRPQGHWVLMLGVAHVGTGGVPRSHLHQGLRMVSPALLRKAPSWYHSDPPDWTCSGYSKLVAALQGIVLGWTAVGSPETHQAQEKEGAELLLLARSEDR